MSPDCTVHIIDDDEAVRDSLVFLVSASGCRAESYPSATAFLDKLSHAAPGCIVSDVRMPGMTGLELLKRLKERSAFDMPVIIITGHGDVSMAVEAMKAGAHDFIEKPFSDEALLAAIRAALEAKANVDRKEADRAAATQKLASLSGREMEVLQGLVAGRPNKVIALDLGISPRTVEIYRANVMSKTGAGSLSELVRMALLTGAAPD